jgi:phenylalanyl-tRNA synthetase beta chain
MKFSLEWLRELSGAAPSADEAARALTRVGLAVDAVEGAGDDAVLDVDVPSNRPDCLSHRGLARELAAALGAAAPAPPSARPSAPGAAGAAPEGAAPLPVDIEDPSLCARYTALRVGGVRVGSSPAWMQRRLERSGMRPRNVIVDITNYVMLETGQPLHAFDLERLEGGRLAVRRTRPGEKLVTLDGVERTLDSGLLVIADARRPVALAGVMGGLDSEIRDSTREVVIESACFDAPSVRRTARALGLRTEASQRFERGADAEGALEASRAAAALMHEHAGGRPQEAASDLYPGRRAPRALRLRPARLAALLGMEVETGRMRAILERLGFAPRAAGDAIEVRPPSWRLDIGCEEDLIEEVARHHGYDPIPATLPERIEPAGGADGDSGAMGRLPAALTALHGHGFAEAICTVFVNGPHNALFAPADGSPVRLLNPLSEAGDELRSSLLPGLLASLRRNLNRGAAGAALYEIGVVFATRGRRSPPDEELRLALAAAGSPWPGGWDRRAAPADPYDLKGALEELLARCGCPPLEISPARDGALHPGRGCGVSCGGEALGVLGQLHPRAARALELPDGVAVAEISLGALARVPVRPRALQAPPRTPAVVRDLALVVPRRQAYAEVARSIRALDPRIVGVEVFDRYESERLGPERVGLALHVVYQHPERTLVSQEVEELEGRILARLQESYGISLRSQ